MPPFSFHSTVSEFTELIDLHFCLQLFSLIQRVGRLPAAHSNLMKTIYHSAASHKNKLFPYLPFWIGNVSKHKRSTSFPSSSAVHGSARPPLTDCSLNHFTLSHLVTHSDASHGDTFHFKCSTIFHVGRNERFPFSCSIDTAICQTCLAPCGRSALQHAFLQAFLFHSCQ